MTMTVGMFQHKFDTKLLRLVIAVIGLLLIEAFINHLPMVENINSTGKSSLTSLSAIIGAVVDTFIFVAIIACARDISILMRSRVSQIREIDKMIMLATWTVVIAMGYSAYQGIIAPLLGHYAGFYDWFAFLLLLIPLIQLLFTVYRNFNPIVEMTAASLERTSLIGKDLIMRNRPAATLAQGELPQGEPPQGDPPQSENQRS